jgi:hypothetical protein
MSIAQEEKTDVKNVKVGMAHNNEKVAYNA